MASEYEELRKLIVAKYNDSKAQHLYFLLGVAGAGIAFLVQKTDGESFTLSTIFAILAMLCWAVSFASGCEVVRRNHEILRYELELVKERTAADSDGRSHEAQFDLWVQKQLAFIGQKNSRNTKFQSAQLVMLGAGVLAFVVWYISRLGATLMMCS